MLPESPSGGGGNLQTHHPKVESVRHHSLVVFEGKLSLKLHQGPLWTLSTAAVHRHDHSPRPQPLPHLRPSFRTRLPALLNPRVIGVLCRRPPSEGQQCGTSDSWNRANPSQGREWPPKRQPSCGRCSAEALKLFLAYLKEQPTKATCAYDVCLSRGNVDFITPEDAKPTPLYQIQNFQKQRPLRSRTARGTHTVPGTGTIVPCTDGTGTGAVPVLVYGTWFGKSTVPSSVPGTGTVPGNRFTTDLSRVSGLFFVWGPGGV